jgi:hypothetical protein
MALHGRTSSTLKVVLAIAAVVLVALLILGQMLLGNYGKTCSVMIGNATYLHHEMSESQCLEAGGVYR